jgi:hypothetical protein
MKDQAAPAYGYVVRLTGKKSDEQPYLPSRLSSIASSKVQNPILAVVLSPQRRAAYF